MVEVSTQHSCLKNLNLSEYYNFDLAVSGKDSLFCRSQSSISVIWISSPEYNYPYPTPPYAFFNSLKHKEIPAKYPGLTPFTMQRSRSKAAECILFSYLAAPPLADHDKQYKMGQHCDGSHHSAHDHPPKSQRNTVR